MMSGFPVTSNRFSAHGKKVFDLLWNYCSAFPGISVRGSADFAFEVCRNMQELLPDITGLEDGEVKDVLIRRWATGFMIGARCNGVDWSPLTSDKKSSFPLTLINTLSIRPDDPVPLSTKELRDIWRKMDYCVIEINKFWLPYRQQEQAKEKGMALATESDRIGGNEPCPCGSGKKFKKCCGR
jgi:uncharacterized protein YecA (UPF0149 family)